LIGGLIVGAFSLAGVLWIPDTPPGSQQTGLRLIAECPLTLAVVLIVLGILDLLVDLLVRVIPENLREAKRLRRFHAGLCVRCEYDLRGSTDRCPECGTPFERWVRGPDPS
jgi:hypothetical protein